ncbi:MAG: Nudix family hydrolase [Thiohalocapsa sp.]
MPGSASFSDAPIHVAAGAIADDHGRILIAKRSDQAHQGGLWEFPGGKLHAGESPVEGLGRELLEELGIQVRASRPLIRIKHDYGDRRVLMDVYRVEAYDGEPVGREGQPLAWVEPDVMDPELFPAADRPIINALRLPSLYLITGDDPTRLHAFMARLGSALAAGVRLIQLRAHGLTDSAYALLARRAYALCHAAGARLVLNRDPKQVVRLPCDGIHLTAVALRRLRERPCAFARLAGASCHDADDLQRAARLDLDYALLSPVDDTPTHPAAASLGWPRFAELVNSADLPVYALGGMTPAHVDRSIAHGGQGIAAIRGLWPRPFD